MLKYAGEMAMRYPLVMVAGEITTQAGIGYEEVVRGVVGSIGCDSCLDDLLSVVCRCRVDRETKKWIEDASCEWAGGRCKQCGEPAPEWQDG